MSLPLIHRVVRHPNHPAVEINPPAKSPSRPQATAGMMPGMRLIRRFIYRLRLWLQADVRDVFNLAEVAERKRRTERRWP